MAYIGANEVREIRNELKKTFPTLKFSVRKNGYSSVTVSIMKGDVDFSPILDKSGAIDVNHYHLGNYGEFAGLFGKINDIIKSAPAKAKDGCAWYNNSDAMTDYFDVAFYYNITVGKWSKPYIKVA